MLNSRGLSAVSSATPTAASFHRPMDIEVDPAYAPGTTRLGALGVFPSLDHLKTGFTGLVEGMFEGFPELRGSAATGGAAELEGSGAHHVHVLHIALLTAPAEVQASAR